MNYRHAFHAGNHADVLKHAVLVRLLLHLAAKEKAFRVVDAQAGAGLYDLAGEEARRTGEAALGIARVAGAADAPAPLRPYLEIVASFNAGGAGPPRWYPGSPLIARALLRSQDRLVAVELHAEDHAALARRLAGDRRVQVRREDGWAAAASFVPPPERRGLLLLDPPYEASDEPRRLVAALRHAHRRWPTGTYLLWYPVKDPAIHAGLLAALAATGIPDQLAVELTVHPAGDPARLAGSGLAVVNPPWTLAAELGLMLPWLHARLRQTGGGWRVAPIQSAHSTALAWSPSRQP